MGVPLFSRDPADSLQLLVEELVTRLLRYCSHSTYERSSRPQARAVVTTEQAAQEAAAPLGVSQNSQ